MILFLALLFLFSAATDPGPVNKWWVGFLFFVIFVSLERKWR